MFNLDDCLALITARSAKIFVTSLEQRLRKYNITRIQCFALYYIHNHQGITQRELADLLSVKEPAVARLVSELERQNLLLRAGNSMDKRSRLLSLTVHGEETYEAIIPEVESFKDHTIQGISQEHLDILKSSLERMVENARKE